MNVTTWLTNNYNTYIVQYLQPGMVYSMHGHSFYILEASSKRPINFSLIGGKPNEILQFKWKSLLKLKFKPELTKILTRIFLRSKKKKGRQREKRKGFKAETVNRLPPRSKYCFNHSRASRIRKFFLSANHGGWQYFSYSMAPSLWSPPALLWNIQMIGQ